LLNPSSLSSPVDVYRKLVEGGFFSRGHPRRERRCVSLALEAFWEKLAEGKPLIIFVQLPTSYGKTAFHYSLGLWAALSDDYLQRSVQVLPLRAIVEEAHKNLKEGLKRMGGGKAAGAEEDLAEKIAGTQHMFSHKTPFFQKWLISTTLDTFALALGKLPPLEIPKIARTSSLGHYELVRAALLTSSFVMFDEAHLFIEEKEGSGRTLTAFFTILYALLKLGVPIIVSTATLTSNLRSAIIGKIKNLFGGGVNVLEIEYGEKLKFNERTEELKDEAFEEGISRKKITTHICGEEKLEEILREKVSSYKRVLLVMNTIGRATSAFEKFHDLKPVLLHSKFTQADKLSKIDELEKKEWFAISTQVIEAGVNVSAEVLISDIAPASALVQRFGRCCRKDEDQEGEAIVLVSKEELERGYYIYDERLLMRTKEFLDGNLRNAEFSWRKYGSYEGLLEHVYGEYQPKLEVNTEFLRLLLSPYTSSEGALDLLCRYGSFTRESPLIPGFVESDKLTDVSDKQLRELMLPLEWNDVKSIYKSSSIEVLVYDGSEFVRKIERIDRPEKFIKKMIYQGIVGIVVPSNHYRPEVGLLHDLRSSR